MRQASAVVRGLIWLAAGLATLAAGAVLICPGGQCRVVPIDRFGLGLMNGLRTPHLDHFFTGLTWLGSLWILVPATLAFVGWQGRVHRAERLFLPLSLLLATSMAHLSKILIQRPRPELFPPTVALPQDWSFPSAHTMQAVAFYVALVMLFAAERRVPGYGVAAVLILLIGCSRLYLQVHFPTDVVFGAIAAMCCIAAAYYWALPASLSVPRSTPKNGQNL